MRRAKLLFLSILAVTIVFIISCQQEESPVSSDTAGGRLYHGGCTYTPGWFKNHPNQWPTLPGGVMVLADFSYTKTEVVSILKQPVNGNGLVILAHAYFAARLNLFRANGVYTPPQEVQDAINDAHFLADNIAKVPPVGNGYLAPDFVKDGVSLQEVATLLDDFNNGIIGPGHCD